MATSRDALRSPSLAAPGGAAFPDLDDVDEVEEVDVDDDVSAADLTGEALLPGGEPPTLESARLDPEHTAPRAVYPPAPDPAEEPPGLWEPTTPGLDAGPDEGPPAGIREQARLVAGSLGAAFSSGGHPVLEDPTGQTLLPDERTEALDPLEPLTPLTPLLPAPPPDEALAESMAEEPAEEMVLSGSLGSIPLIDILALLGRQRQTGVLTVLSEGRRIDITLERGQVAQATGHGFGELRLGRFVVEMEAAAPREIDELASAATALGPTPGAGAAAEPMPLGARLCQLGYLSRDDLRQALSRQSQELIYEALRLRAGRFVFTQPAALPRLAVDRTVGANLHMDLEAMLLEGYRRIHEWHLLEQELEEGAVYMRADERATAERAGLTSKEQQVLSLCTGRNALSDIARDSRLGKLDVARILQRLQAVNLVRRRLPPQAI